MSQNRMLINYVPGDECRVAITRDGLLEELYAERLSAVSHVGNIYVGKVVNVESSIQAAFIDFGLEHNGFLHITDLHPQYFPGEDNDAVESVGKKTPRRERPPIQHALKRGQEITVQVIKEGIGTKGPTLTSYLSIPGRCLVMMPQMDRVGVSRKIEDDETRREAKKILDDLDLPEGFGFILRTAGLGKNKTEVKRDLAYLQRLWKDMELRRRAGSKPRLLYTESDLLVRSLRDHLAPEIDEIVVDHPAAIARASRFLKIVAPRSTTRLINYDRPTPMFHAFGIEQQIRAIHKREVQMPSGGRLVIDETEALVAIDVNSGKMRASNDAEITAFKTNMEAADEICRQIRLRDLGGLVVLDLIDMRSRTHRRDVENKFKALFKRDRARTKLLPISPLGLLELTRQRMRGSLRSAHFTECRTCAGVGVVQRPDSVASDSLRELARILFYDSIRRVEMVVSPRVAGELLSSKRNMLARLERHTGKRVDVRVSETIPADHVNFYAYDERAADVDIDKLPTVRPPVDLKPWEDHASDQQNWAVDPGEEAASAAASEPLEEFVEDVPTDDLIAVSEDDIDDTVPTRRVSNAKPVADADTEGEGESETGGKRKRRRRRRRRKGDPAPEDTRAERPAPPVSSPAQAEPAQRDDAEHAQEEQDEDGPKRKRRRRRRRRKSGEGVEAGEAHGAPGVREHAASNGAAPSEHAAPSRLPESHDEETPAEGETGGKKKRRRRRRRRSGAGAETAHHDAQDAQDTQDAPSSDAEHSAPAEPAPAPAPDDAPSRWMSEPKAETPAPKPAADESVAKAPAKTTKKKTTRKKAPAAKKKTAKKTAKKKTTRKKAPSKSQSASDKK